VEAHPLRMSSRSADHRSEEYTARVDLAAAYRLMARFGMDDLTSTHLTLRVAGDGDLFLINPFGLMFTEVTASSLVKVDRNGDVVDSSPQPINKAGFVIHGAIHEARPDALCVLHSHSLAGVAVSALECGLLPISQFALRFYDQIAYHDYGGGARDIDMRSAMIRDLGDKKVMIMRNHGLLTTGRTVAEAFFLMYYLDRACRIQLAAQGTNSKLVIPPEDLCVFTVQQQMTGTVDVDGNHVPVGDRDWPALLRMLDQTDPSFRD